MPKDADSMGDTVKLGTKQMLQDLSDNSGSGFNDVYESSQ